MNKSSLYSSPDDQLFVEGVSPEDLNHRDGVSVLPLVGKLCDALAKNDIAYCHWKSNDVLERSASGENDLDLLVSRIDVPRFAEILYRLKFKQARSSPEKRLPGVMDFYGYDLVAEKLIHVHAHYQLVLGHDMTKNYRLPIERPYLESAVQGDVFKVPAPELEFIVFIIRMVVKHATWDVILGGEGKLKAAERRELSYLHRRVSRDGVRDALKRHLPFIDVELFDNCINALEPACSRWTRLRTGRKLQAKLKAEARRRLPVDILLKMGRRALLAFRRRILKSSRKARLEAGGALIAIVGGDGAGKSTALDALYAWLSETFETTRVHMGKPPWSWTTISIRAVLKIGHLLGLYPAESSVRETLNQRSLVSTGYPWMLREVCRARDRYRTYWKARRFAANGGLVFCDRYPLPQIQLMDGRLAARFLWRLKDSPQGERYLAPHEDSRLANVLVKLEESYYKRIVPPELLFVFRVDPELAVQRKAGEDATLVRERSREIWELHWEHTDAHIIDASKSKAEVVRELKALIWSEL